MTCIVVDDEEVSLNHIVKHYVGKVPYLTLLGAFTNPNEALLFLQTRPVDLVFLDIEMPNYAIGGIEFMKITRADQQYVLITAHPEYALESYEYHVIDYLHKPFAFDRFAKAVQKAQGTMPVQGEAAEKSEMTMYLRAEGKVQRVNMEDILYVEADRNYATIFQGHTTVSIKKTMRELEEELPTSRFLRVHRSYIVALNKISTVGRDDVAIQMPEKMMHIPLSSQYKKAVLKAIQQSAKNGTIRTALN